MSTREHWGDVAPEAQWATNLRDELLEATTQTPDELLARAQELRSQAAITDIDGYRTGCLKLADRYEQTAALRRSVA